MNFLAHLYLSGDSKELQVGNFIGDFVKGEPSENFPEMVRKGIILHRKIDEFTDSHEIVYQSKSRLREKYRHYAPVIVDIYYDHFLAKYWDDFHQTSLKDFTDQCYRNILSHDSFLPEKVKFMMPYMMKDNWLFHYQYLDGIQRVMHGMSKRTTFDSGMERSVADLVAHYDEFENEFRLFFPELNDFCESYRS